MYIANQEELEAFVERAMHSSVLAIDTEFMREKTYFATLCLMQLATDDEVALVDPFKVDDLSVLAPLLQDPGIMKVFHAAREDLEIINHEIGVVPWPIFDTQIAASLLGHSQQIGYGGLVKAVCDVTLDKLDSYTDWSRRPLSASQLAYAENDVAYLPRLYKSMRESLERRGRLNWLDPDFKELVERSSFVEDPLERYRRLRRANQLSGPQLCAARAAAAWREQTARRRNVPRKFVLSDEQIVEACKRNAKSIDDLYIIRGVRERLSTKDARELAQQMEAAYLTPEDEWPTLDVPSTNETNVDAKVELLASLVSLRAKQNDIATQTLASRKDLASVARGHRDVPVLRGWRKQIVGRELLDLLAGNISLCIEGGSVKVAPRADENRR